MSRLISQPPGSSLQILPLLPLISVTQIPGQHGSLHGARRGRSEKVLSVTPGAFKLLFLK